MSESMSNNEDAVRFICEKRTMLMGYLKALLRDYILAEDAFAELSLEILNAWDKCDHSRNTGAWARGIAKHVASRIRRQTRRHDYKVIDYDLLEHLAQAVENEGTGDILELRKDALECCLRELPNCQRELVTSRYYSGWPYSDVARMVGRDVAAVRVILFRLRQILKECIEKRLEGM